MVQFNQPGPEKWNETENDVSMPVTLSYRSSVGGVTFAIVLSVLITHTASAYNTVLYLLT